MTRLQMLRRRFVADALLPKRGERMPSAAANVPTQNGSRYLQQLCKHWAHNLLVEFTADRGSVVFPKDARGADFPGDGLLTLSAAADHLALRIDATSPEQMEGLKGVAERHLDRFAFREAPLTYDWVEA